MEPQDRNARGVPAQQYDAQKSRTSNGTDAQLYQEGCRTCIGSCFAVKPQRSPSYLAYIRTLPCLICGAYGSESAHTGPHGLSQKACDFRSIPLCSRCHRMNRDSNHTLGRHWAAHHGIDLSQVIGALKLAYFRCAERSLAP